MDPLVTPLTDYDKTLHNWLRLTRQRRNPKLVQIGREGASGQISEI